MALAQCPECSGQVSTTLSVCPHCGFFLARNKPGPPPLPSEPAESPVTSPAKKEGEKDAGRVGAAGQRIRAARSRSGYPVQSDGMGKVVLVAALLLVGGAVALWFKARSRVVDAPAVVSEPGYDSFARESGAGGRPGLPEMKEYPRESHSDLKEAEDEGLDIDLPGDLPAEVGIVDLPLPGEDEVEAGSFNFGLSEWDVERAKDILQDEDDGEYEKAFSKGMELFDAGDYTGLIVRFQTLSSDGGLIAIGTGQVRKERLGRWMLWADFLSAVEHSILHPETDENDREIPGDRYIKLILATGSEIEGELVSEDADQVVVKRGSIRSTHKEGDILKRVYSRAPRPVVAETIPEIELRDPEKIAADLKSLTLDEVFFLYRDGVEIKSKEWVLSVLKKVPEENPGFASGVLRNIAEMKDMSVIEGLRFQTPDSHLALARECRERDLSAGFKKHRLLYLELRGALARGAVDHCKGCKDAGEVVCKVCKGDCIEEVPYVVSCGICGSEGYTQCETCDGRGEGTCSFCNGRGYRTVLRRGSKVRYGWVSGGSGGSYYYTKPCPRIGKCRTCNGKGKKKCYSCTRSQNEKIKQTCTNCDPNGLSLCRKCK